MPETHLLRSQLQALPRIDAPSDWIYAFELPGDVIALAEPCHFQEVISFLIMGKERALLFDTGMGIGDMKSVAESLCSLPVSVVHSHSHFDHVGGDRQFGSVRLLNIPACVRRLEEGYRLPEGDENLLDSAFFCRPTPAWDPLFGSCPVEPFEDGEEFDLGGRRLAAYAAPGHSPDSAVLEDRENAMLFCGDTLYDGPLYSHLEGSNPKIYGSTLAWLARQYEGYSLLCSHNEPMQEHALLNRAAGAFEALLASGAGKLPADGKLKLFACDGIKIYYKEGDLQQ